MPSLGNDEHALAAPADSTPFRELSAWPQVGKTMSSIAKTASYPFAGHAMFNVPLIILSYYRHLPLKRRLVVVFERIMLR